MIYIFLVFLLVPFFYMIFYFKLSSIVDPHILAHLTKNLKLIDYTS